MGLYAKIGWCRPLTRKYRERALEALRNVGLADFADRQIAQLSGGQQQRVFVARALAQNADLYLMDEPFAGVDAASEDAILTLLSEMKSAGKTVLIVHHDLQTARQFFDHIVLLNTRLVAHGPTEEVFTEDYLQEAYGGQLTILSRVADMVKQRDFPVREKQFRDKP